MAGELKTVTVEDVEILRVGTFTAARGGRQTFTAEDLDEIVAAHEALVESGHFPTVYLGHNPPEGSELPEPPSVGRIATLRRVGDRLVSRLTDVPVLVAKLMKAKAYGTRSIEGMRTSISGSFKIGDRTFRQVITGLALLGKSLPAVNGLADVEKLYAADGADTTWVDVPLAMAAGDDPLERVLAAVDALSEGVEELIKGKAFAPAIRQRLRMLRTDLRRFAGPTTVEAQMNLRKALGLGDDASDSDVTAALVALAGAADPATAMAVIAEILGMPDGDPPAIVARVRELAGGGTAAGDGADPTKEPAMSSKLSDPGGDAATVTLQALHTEHVKVLQRLAELEGTLARGAAVQDVNAAIAAGKFLPAQRETLVSLRLADEKAFANLVAGQGVAVHLGEKGTAGKPDASAYEPSAEEVRVAMSMGMSRDTAVALLRSSKAAEAGVTLPGKEG